MGKIPLRRFCRPVFIQHQGNVGNANQLLLFGQIYQSQNQTSFEKYGQADGQKLDAKVKTCFFILNSYFNAHDQFLLFRAQSLRGCDLVHHPGDRFQSKIDIKTNAQ
jgi:hypothetical protein